MAIKSFKIIKKKKRTIECFILVATVTVKWDSPVWAVTGRVDFGVVIESESGVQPAAAGHACATGTSSTKAA